MQLTLDIDDIRVKSKEELEIMLVQAGKVIKAREEGAQNRWVSFRSYSNHG
jgi:hypothetical protein